MPDFLIVSLKITFNLLVIHVGDQSDEEEDFGKRFLAVNLTNPLVLTFCYFTRVGRAPTLKPSENFSFGNVFLRRGTVTDIEENNFHVVMGWSR